ncbi:MAG: YfhO family protein [Lachnospiraceae bacterium]|nr:YfhO family protein [Lachnospiraceae bacterium]
MNKASVKEFFRRNLPVILAFFIVTAALAVMFIARGIYPFGEEMYLRSDMYHQYAPFLKLFQRMLQNGDGMLFSWNLGLGTDFISTYSYYLASPINWLVAIFPSTIIPEIMGGFIIVKAGLMASVMTYYLREHFRRNDWFGMLFGIFYAFSSYMAAYSWNLMWLDCLMLLPLIILGLEKLVKQNKVALYTITLAIAIISNYYISIMICIFLVLYFIYLICCERSKGAPNLLLTFGRFALYSVIAALIACFVLIPTVSALFYTASGSFKFPHNFSAYFNMLEMISRAVMCIEPTVLHGYFPNIYCTVAAFIFIPLYWIGRRISVRERIGKTVLMAVLLISFTFNIPTYIWHGFHFPNSLSARHSFLYIFLLLTMVYEAVATVRDYSYKEIVICFVASAGAVFGLHALYDTDKFPLLVCYLNIGFLLLYMLWAVLRKTGKASRTLVIISILIVGFAEAMINTNYTGYTTANRTYYVSDNADIEAVLDSIEDTDFYRVEKIKRRTKNDGTWSDYKSASEFSSTTLAGVTSLYKAMGMQGMTNSYSYYGHTPLTGAILGVRYELSNDELTDSLKTLVAESGNIHLYRNKYSLAPAFVVNIDTKAETNTYDSNPFGVQNSFVEAACDLKNFFIIGDTTRGENINITASQEGRFFIYITNKIDSATVTVMRGAEEIFNRKFDSLENPQILDIGDVKTGDEINVVSNDENTTDITVIPAMMKYDTFEHAIELLGRNQMNVTEYSNGYMKGTVHADRRSQLFTTIPYYKGWTVYVDGVKAEYTSFYDAFVMVELQEGDHTVEFRYWPEGFSIGIAASVLGLLAFVILLLIRRRLYPEHPADGEWIIEEEPQEKKKLSIMDFVETEPEEDEENNS